MADLADAVIWTTRLVLVAGLGWGAWLCVGQMLPPPTPGKTFELERFATFALLILLFTSLGGFLHAS